MFIMLLQKVLSSKDFKVLVEVERTGEVEFTSIS